VRHPSNVVDRTLPLGKAADGYRARHERTAGKALFRP
jgi:hypothetical protein